MKPSCDYTIHTIASVGRIKWRPQRKYHIASCALVVDCSINVWDIRRPYIPFASFNEHKDVPTGVAWRGNPQTFLSTSRVILLFVLYSIYNVIKLFNLCRTALYTIMYSKMLLDLLVKQIHKALP